VTRCFFGHDYGDLSDSVDTGNHIYKAQFKSCNRCNKVVVRYIKMMEGSSIAPVSSENINKALKNA